MQGTIFDGNLNRKLFFTSTETGLRILLRGYKLKIIMLYFRYSREK